MLSICSSITLSMVPRYILFCLQTQMILLLVLIASQVDFVVGSILGPKNDEEKAKGFVGYSSKLSLSLYFKYIHQKISIK